MLGFIFTHTRGFSDVTAMKTLYYAFVRSVIQYCSVIWSTYYQCHIFDLENVLHKILIILIIKFRIENHHSGTSNSGTKVCSSGLPKGKMVG